MAALVQCRTSQQPQTHRMEPGHFAAGGDEVGEDTEVTYKTTCVYYKQTRNGVVEFEIDVLNKVFIVGGVDRMAEERRILGL